MKVSVAKMKVCPFVQMPQESFDIIGGQRVQNILCICGHCMAWVFTDEYDYPQEEQSEYGYCRRIGNE